MPKEVNVAGKVRQGGGRWKGLEEGGVGQQLGQGMVNWIWEGGGFDGS